MSDNGSPNGAAAPRAEGGGESEHLNIKVTDSTNEIFFKIKRTTQLKKLMDAFCERSGKAPTSVRFLFDGTRVAPTDNPESVCFIWASRPIARKRTKRLT
jgi:small ubiquitin-related modifier